MFTSAISSELKDPAISCLLANINNVAPANLFKIYINKLFFKNKYDFY